MIECVIHMLNFLGNDLRFNEVHVNSYKNKQGKIRYKGSLRVYSKEISFEDKTLDDLYNLLQGILIGYLFCKVKNDYEK